MHMNFNVILDNIMIAFLRKIFLLFVLWVNMMPIYARFVPDYKILFEYLQRPAPDTLSLDYLKSFPKFRCIFHDGFDRLDTIPRDRETGELRKFFSIGNDSILGRNSFQNTRAYSYLDLKLNNDTFAIGIKDNAYAYNKVDDKNNNRIFRLIDTSRKDYGFLIAKSSEMNADAKVAFRVKDKSNYYYAKITAYEISLFLVTNNRQRRIFKKSIINSKCLYGLIEGDEIYLYADYRFIGKQPISRFRGSTSCGLLFIGKEKSEVDDFAVNYLDSWTDNHVDEEFEKGILGKKNVGWYETESGMLKVYQTYTNHSNFSLRYQLDYYEYEEWEKHKIGNSRRTEIVPRTENAAPLDSWICSFDILFPGKDDGNEYYKKDSLDELFWQQHAPVNINTLSPNVALYLRNDIITFQALSRRILRHDRLHNKSHRDYHMNGVIALLVDSLTGNKGIREIERGKWHRFTIFIKEGYSENQLPRSIVYMDGKKVIDWFIPNMQNCGEQSTYLKIGIYKWPWAHLQKRVDVKQRVLYYDNLMYLR